jgi:hypothetical protein
MKFISVTKVIPEFAVSVSVSLFSAKPTVYDISREKLGINMS